MKRILIANRGEIARRVIATAHRMGIETVAVYSDADANALHVREATTAHALGGNASADSYLRIDKLLAAAQATGADAVHPGYGFLSEDAGFAQAVVDAGLVWIGPPPAAIRALGSKSAAKALAQAHGVPCLPGYAGSDQGEARFADEAARIGYPVMVKAVAGGGGRGMRLVTAAAQLPAALASARAEALAAFSNGDLLIERALLNPRHVEVQVFADAHGHAIHLSERDCSVQRRHQKIIEEAPSPAVDAALRERLGACAVALACAAGYMGAGTVEFLLDGSEFFLMEMNTRLQVEHPVTEALTGLDLVEWQIRIARGEPLPLAQDEVRLDGHAIEVRLCAEDEHYTPHAGRVLHWSAPSTAAFERAPLRFDHAMRAGSEVTPYYDAMLGKLIAHAGTRAEAIDQLIAALGRLQVLGLPTNRAFLIECLQDERFRAGEARIAFLARHGDELREKLLKKEQQSVDQLAPAAVFGHESSALPCRFAVPLRLRHRERVLDLPVRAPVAAARAVHAVRVPAPGDAVRWHAQSGAVDWWIDDLSYTPPETGGAGQAATELRAPFNGKVVRVAARPGQALAAGETALVIESMKLEHSLSPRAGATVAEVRVAEGQQVAPGQVLLRFAAPGEAR
ncbi:acetyl/propionyl/methylcrotonyl-CoA carboxylase subunit alpha [Ottowia sp.]|uniref:acetyl/propionyl/methylcrotonyl-CoA carboxylase subunit alpha n=1 Tax=Ottowia sp. TaxID=1898956 RepID=UPI0039E3DCEB